MRTFRLLSLCLLPLRLLARAVASIFGSVRFGWSPPSWPRAMIRKPGWTVAALVILVSAGYGTAHWYRSREANRARPRELVNVRELEAKVAAPAVPSWDEKTNRPSPAPIVVNFSTDAAPIDAAGKEAEGEPATLEPAVQGRWIWNTARELKFEPEQPLPAGETFKLVLNADGVAAHTNLAKREFSFKTPELTFTFADEQFNTDPQDPTKHQAVVTLVFNQPVKVDELSRNLAVESISGGPLLKEGSKFEVHASPKSGTRYHARSPLVQIPEQEDFVRFRVLPQLAAYSGGRPIGRESAAKVKVPTRSTGFVIAGVQSRLVPDEDGEPQQFLFVETGRAAETAQFAKHVEAFALPPLPEGVEEWTAGTVTKAILGRSPRVPLELVAGEDTASHATTFAFRLQPREPGSLWVRIPAGVSVPGGFVLAEEYAQGVEVPAFPKEVAVLGEGGVLALTGERKLTIKSRGFEHLRFTLGRVPAGQINHLVSQTGGNFQSPHFRGGTFGISNIARVQHSVTDIAKKNDHEANYSAFDFGPELARALAGDNDPARGLFFLQAEGVRPRGEEDKEADAEDPDPKWIALAADGTDIEWGDENDSEDRRFVLITDLGLVVKRAADGKRDVFVLSFAKRSPVAGVQVTALARNGEPLAEARTDAQGRAELPALDGHKREKKPVAILARLGSDIAFLPWARDDREVELSRFDVAGVQASQTGELDAFLFTERGVYRPGDSIYLGAVVRRRDWKAGIEGVTLRAILTNSADQEVDTQPVTVTEDGFAELQFATAETAPTGVWSINLQRVVDEEGKVEELGQTRVRVEDFQPDRLKLTAKLNHEMQGWVAPEDLAVHLEVKTLFDLSAANRRITGKLRILPARGDFQGWKDWRFHLPEEQPFEAQEVELTEQRSDEAGRASFALDLQAHTAPLLQVGVTVEAFEADGGRGVQGGVSALVSPRELLLGWKAEGDLNYISRDVPCNLRVVAIGRDLQPVAAPELTRVLLETRNVSVLAKQENGSLNYVSQTRDQEVERVDGSLAASETVLPLPVSKAGRFRYEWRDTKGTVLCAVAFNVVGPADVSRGLQRDAELELALSKREWRAGEALEFSVRAPYAGAGLITIERERVLAWKWFEAGTASSVQRITIPEGLEGGAHVHVAFVRRLDSPEIFVNPLSVGVAPFKISKEHRRLSVRIDAPELIEPGKTLVMGVSTPRPSRVAVWAVDDGIHRVSKYKLPQPLTAFFQPPALEVTTWQLLDLLLPEFSLVKKSRAYGGDGDAELEAGLNPFKRKRNAPVVYWSGIVECGPERRELTFQVPDYFAGRLNIMAVAVAQDGLGSQEAATIVKGPFVLTPNVPVFAAPGDEFIASLTIANQTIPPTDRVAISAKVSENLEVIESPEAVVTIPPNTEGTFRYRVRVKPILGNAEIRFAAGAGTQRVELVSTLSARPAAPAVSRIETGWFREDTHEVEVGRPLYAEFAQREAVVSNTPMGLGHGLARYLREFPYGCTEQTTSKAFPYLLNTTEAPFAPSREEAEKAIAHACRTLFARQRSDGGFGYWTPANGQDGLDELTIYVAHFLTEARASGFEVPDSLITSALRRLKVMAGLPVRSRQDANAQAAAIYLLTRSGEVTTNYALNLVDTLRREHGTKWHRDNSAAWLAATWSLLKMETEAQALMAQHRAAIAQPQDEKDRVEGFYAAALSSAAQSFAVVCRHFPEVAGRLTYEELRPITEPVQRGEFHTHSAAWTILALKSYTKWAQSSSVELSVAEQSGGAWKALTGRSFGMDATRIQFRRKPAAGAPTAGAWYQTMEFGFPKSAALKPETRGIEIVREFLDGSGQPLSQVKVGTSVKVRLRARNVHGRPLSHIAIVDLQPGGFENAPGSLRPGLGTLPGANFVDAREDRNLLFIDLAAGQSRSFEWEARPTCAGTFAVPAAFAEAMYDRAISGSGVTGNIVVLPQ